MTTPHYVREAAKDTGASGMQKKKIFKCHCFLCKYNGQYISSPNIIEVMYIYCAISQYIDYCVSPISYICLQLFELNSHLVFCNHDFFSSTEALQASRPRGARFRRRMRLSRRVMFRSCTVKIRCIRKTQSSASKSSERSATTHLWAVRPDALVNIHMSWIWVCLVMCFSQMYDIRILVSPK